MCVLIRPMFVLQYNEMPPVRVVFDVTLEGLARKVITVRSALMIHNQLEEVVELSVEAPGMHQYSQYS